MKIIGHPTMTEKQTTRIARGIWLIMAAAYLTYFAVCLVPGEFYG